MAEIDLDAQEPVHMFAAADNGVAPTAWVAHFPTMPSMTLSATPTTISRRSSTVARPKTTAMIPNSATLTGWPESLRNTASWPSPPRHCPAPPESGTSA